MGKWTLDGLSGDWADHDADGNFGHSFNIRFRLRYNRSLVRDQFVDTPKLVWHEIISTKDHVTQRFWRFEGNLFTHKRGSRTLMIWSRRYLEAYRAMEGTPSIYGGSARLYKKSWRLFNGRNAPVAAEALGAVGGTDRDQAEAIRSYLQRHGDILEIEVNDRPALRLATVHVPIVNKERLVLFTFGVIGGTLWRRASQYLRYDSTAAPPLMVRNFALEATQRGSIMPSWAPERRSSSQPWVDSFTEGDFTSEETPANVATPDHHLYFPDPDRGEYP